jgi:hypothetical protein
VMIATFRWMASAISSCSFHYSDGNKYTVSFTASRKLMVGIEVHKNFRPSTRLSWNFYVLDRDPNLRYLYRHSSKAQYAVLKGSKTDISRLHHHILLRFDPRKKKVVWFPLPIMMPAAATQYTRRM